MKVSHPERIIDPSTGLKKLNLVRYYESIGEWMLPHLKDRPVSLVRALLTELGLSSWLKTSGGKGLHVVVPLAPRLSYDVVKDFSQAIVQHLAQLSRSSRPPRGRARARSEGLPHASKAV